MTELRLFEDPQGTDIPELVEGEAFVAEEPAVEEPAVELDLYSMEGHECFYDPKKLLPSRAARFLRVAQKFVEEEADPFDQGIQLLELVEKHALRDADQYQVLYQERGLEYVLTLAQAWLGELAGGMR